MRIQLVILQSLKVLIIILALFSTTVQKLVAQSTPRWVSKGVNELDKKRSNDTYEFWIYHNHGLNITEIEQEANNSLAEYVRTKYDVDSIELKIISHEPYETYEVKYTNVQGRRNSVVAELIDTYSHFDDFEINVFEYGYYRLYAISKPDIVPIFDDFTLTSKYNSLAMLKSIIPGLAQIYKGQDTKGSRIEAYTTP